MRSTPAPALATMSISLGSLTAGVAHEINNPLAYVRSNLNRVETMIRDLRDAPDAAMAQADWKQRVAESADSIGVSVNLGLGVLVLLATLMRFGG